MSLMAKIATGQAGAEMQEEDFVKDGIIHCGKCKEPKEYPYEIKLGEFQTIKGKGRILCKCEKEAEEERKRKENELNLAAWKEKMIRNGLGKSKFREYTFENDDLKNEQVSNMCKSYAKNFKEAIKDNIGILFYGEVGTGKTYYAVAIANELINQGYSVRVLSITEWINSMQTFDDENRKKELDAVTRVSLLVIDDVGAERETSYGLEQAYALIDERYNSGLPTIATTNKTIKELENPASIGFKRIYDRILEMCSFKLEVAGKSRREGIGENKEVKAMRILGLL